MARIITEAKYRAMLAGTYEVVWLLALLRDFGLDHVGSIQLKCDNQSSLSLSKKPIFRDRTKHIELDVHFIREQVVAEVIKIVYVPTHEQIVDIFTKALSYPQFAYLLSKMICLMNVQCPHTHLEREYQCYVSIVYL